MTHARSQAELVTLRKLAQEIATSRKERVTSVHLLAAIAGSEGAAGELLRERRLDDEVLLKASRAFDDDGPDPIGRLLAAARQVAMRRLWYGNEPAPPPASASRGAPVRPSATRSQSPEPTALHLLLALLSDRSAAAHRSLVHAGIDLARLRTAAMQIALGVVAPRRIPSPRSAPPEAEAEPAAQRALAPARSPSQPPPRRRLGAAPPSGAGPGVTVPIMPSAPVPSRRAAPLRVPSSPPPAPMPPSRASRAAAGVDLARRASSSIARGSRRSPRSGTTSRSPPRRASSTRSSGARRRSSAPSTSSPNATPTARACSAPPASARPRWREAWRAASSRSTARATPPRGCWSSCSSPS